MATRRKRDLIERVRYPNPLPALPHAPRLTRIPEPEPNYVSPMYLQRMAESLQLPLTVDAEAGMPLDLARLEYLWLEDGTHPSEMDGVLEWDKLDEDDAFLLSEAGMQPAEAEDLAPQSTAQAQAASVTWLRRTEYLGAEQRKQKAEAKAEHEAPSHDTSRPAQIERILHGFDAANAPLATLRHPSKPHVHAVEAYELLPDPETWTTSFQVVRFASALGRANDPRWDAAMLRPVTDPITGKQRVSMYLTCADTLPQYGEPDAVDAEELDAETQQRRQDTAAARFKKRRRLGTYPRVPWLDGEDGGDANVYGTGFRHVRDFEPMEQPVPTDHLLAVVMDDEKPDAAPELAHVQADAPISAQDEEEDLFGDEDESQKDVLTTLPPQSEAERARQQHVVAPASQGRKVAYYHHIDMRYGLQIRRARKTEQRLLVPYEGFWHRMIVGHRPMTERELTKRLFLRDGVDKLNLEGLEYVESESEDEAEAHDQEEGHSAPEEDNDQEDGRGAPEEGEEASMEDAAVHVQEREETGHEGPEETKEDEGEEHEEEEDGQGETADEGGEDDADEEADLEVDADELADLQAEADLHPDDMPTEGRRRHT